MIGKGGREAEGDGLLNRCRAAARPWVRIPIPSAKFLFLYEAGSTTLTSGRVPRRVTDGGIAVLIISVDTWVPVDAAVECVGITREKMAQWICQGSVQIKQDNENNLVRLEDCLAMLEGKVHLDLESIRGF